MKRIVQYVLEIDRTDEPVIYGTTRMGGRFIGEGETEKRAVAHALRQAADAIEAQS